LCQTHQMVKIAASYWKKLLSARAST